MVRFMSVTGKYRQLQDRLSLLLPFASRKTPDEDGGSEATVNANGCTLMCEVDNEDALMLTDLQGMFKGVLECMGD